MPSPHDSLFRQTFADPQNAASLLAAVLPKALADAADWSTLTLLPGTFVDPDLRDLQTDLLFSLQVGGETVLVYTLLEHKSFADPWTAFQLLRYAIRVQEAHLRSHPDATRLPPIVPVVVHHGARAFRAARCAAELVDLDRLPPAVQKVLAPLQPNLHFLLDDLAAMSEERIRGRATGPHATLALLLLQFVREVRELDPVRVVERWLPLWRAVAADPASRFGLMALLSYLARHVVVDRERFVTATLRIHEEPSVMALSLYDRAVLEGRRDALLQQLRKRFGDLPGDLLARIHDADPPTIERWIDRILDAKCLADVFG